MLLMKILADKHIPHIEQALAGLGDLTIKHGGEMTPADFVGIDAYLGRSVRRIGEADLAGNDVKFVATASVGTDHIDTQYLASRGIEFVSAAGCNAVSVADYVIGAILELAADKGISLKGKTIGVVGVGNVGSRVAKRCQGLGMEVLLNDPPLKRLTGSAKYCNLDKIYDCDIITFHTPLIREGEDKTYHLFSEEFAKKVKPGAILINSSRGEVVDSDVIIESLNSGILSDIVIDVWTGEPNIDIDLLKIAYIATPHIAGHAIDSKVRAMRMVVEGMCDFFGIDRKIYESDYLPKPEVAVVDFNAENSSLEVALSNCFKNVYDIKKDDAMFRKILDMPKNARSEYFSSLRKNYPVRRELSRTCIGVCPEAYRSILDAAFGLGQDDWKV